jgi:hypothetical protein
MRALVLALLLIAGPAFADDALVPTEGGEQAGGADTGGDGAVSNPNEPPEGFEGTWTAPDGTSYFVCCASYTSPGALGKLPVQNSDNAAPGSSQRREPPRQAHNGGRN